MLKIVIFYYFFINSIISLSNSMQIDTVYYWLQEDFFVNKGNKDEIGINNEK